MVSTLKTSFYLRKPKNYSGGEIPVYLRITVDEQPTELSTGVNCLPSKWIARKGRLKLTDVTSQQLNDILDKLELKAKDNYRYLLEVDPTRLVTAQDIKHLVTGKKIQRIMLLDIFQEHNNKIEALVGEHFAEGTLERYKTTYKHTADFIKMKYKVDDLPITRVNHEFIYEFD